MDPEKNTGIKGVRIKREPDLTETNNSNKYSYK